MEEFRSSECLSDRDSYQIRSYNPLFVFGRRDVPPERLYKDMQLAEKGGIKPGFRIRPRLKGSHWTWFSGGLKRLLQERSPEPQFVPSSELF